MTEHECDLCGSNDFAPLEVARPYIGDNEPPVVCMNCGFVYVRNRRSSEEVARAWDDIWGHGYTSKWPAVKARLFYVAEWLDQAIGLKDKVLLDIGAGQGHFIKFAVDRGARCTALEPYAKNFERLLLAGADRTVQKTVEQAEREGSFVQGGAKEICFDVKFDIITILWTLENCTDCIGMLKRARKWLKPNGHLVVATGSRILVPFKKPLSMYFSDNPADTHCFRFSEGSLIRAGDCAALAITGFNNWKDSDWFVIAFNHKKHDPKLHLSWLFDEPQEVLDFFNDWSEQFP